MLSFVFPDLRELEPRLRLLLRPEVVRAREDAAAHRRRDRAAHGAVPPVVVARLGPHLPFVHDTAAPLGADLVLRRHVFGVEKVPLGLAPPEGQTPAVAHRRLQALLDERLPEVGVIDHVTDCPAAGDGRDAPVEAHAVSGDLLVFAHRLRGRADVAAVARKHDVRPLGLPAELVHDLGRVAPVGVDETALDLERRSVAAEPLAPEHRVRQLLESRVELPLETGVWKRALQRRVRVGEREVPPALVGPGPVVDDIACEVVVPGAHDVEEQRLLHVDEHREAVAGRGKRLPSVAVELVDHRVDRELLLGPEVFGQRFVLVLRPEGHLVLQLEVHRVLDGRDLVVVVARRPAHDRSRVHRRAVLLVERRRLGERPVLAELLRAEVGVLLPELFVRRELVDELHPLALPLGMLHFVENLVGHVARPDDRAGHHAGDLLAGAGEAEDVAREDADALAGLLERAGRLRGLRVVDDDERRADRAPVRLLELHAADAARDAGDADGDAGRGRALDGRQDDLVRRPRDARPDAVVELPGAAVCDAVERGDGEGRLREVRRDVFVDLQLRLDAFEHFERGALGRADEDDERAVAVEHRPETRGFRQARLAGPARHRECEEPALEDGGLDLLDRPEVVRGPLEGKHFREVVLAERLEVRAAALLSVGVLHLGKLADVAAGLGELRLALPGGVAVLLVGAGRVLGRLVVPVDEVGDVADEVDAARIVGGRDAVADAVEVAVDAVLGDDGPEACGVEDARHLGAAHPRGVNRHGRPPRGRATPRTRRGSPSRRGSPARRRRCPPRESRPRSWTSRHSSGAGPRSPWEGPSDGCFRAWDLSLTIDLLFVALYAICRLVASHQPQTKGDSNGQQHQGRRPRARQGRKEQGRGRRDGNRRRPLQGRLALDGPAVRHRERRAETRGGGARARSRARSRARGSRGGASGEAQARRRAPLARRRGGEGTRGRKSPDGRPRDVRGGAAPPPLDAGRGQDPAADALLLDLPRDQGEGLRGPVPEGGARPLHVQALAKAREEPVAAQLRVAGLAEPQEAGRLLRPECLRLLGELLVAPVEERERDVGSADAAGDGAVDEREAVLLEVAQGAMPRVEVERHVRLGAVLRPGAASAEAAVAAVEVDGELPAGGAAVADGAVDDVAAGAVEDDLRPFRDEGGEVGAEPAPVVLLALRDGGEDGAHLPSVHRDLRLHVDAPEAGADERVADVARQVVVGRHAVRHRIVGRHPPEDALVAPAVPVDALRDVGRLPRDVRGDHEVVGADRVLEAPPLLVGARVADLADGGADQLRDLVIRELGLRGDLAAERHVLALDLDLDREARVRVDLEVAVEKVGGDVVRDLVGVAEGNPFGCLQHGCRLCGCSEVVEDLEMCVSARVRTLS